MNRVQHYSHLLQSLLHNCNTENRLLHIGILGLDSADKIESLIIAFNQIQQSDTLYAQHRIHISLLAGLITKPHCISDLINITLNLTSTLDSDRHELVIAPIEGCQRINIFSNITLDCHFGEPIKQLTGIANHSHRVCHWFACSNTLQADTKDHFYTSAALWQMGRLSDDLTAISFAESQPEHIDNRIVNLVKHCGFHVASDTQPVMTKADEIACKERQALRNQQDHQYAYLGNYQSTPCLPPKDKETNNNNDCIGIIGGGIAAASLALSLAERGKNVVIYCKDSAIAQAASGNKQGAIYPLLTPENGPLSQFYQQAFLYSRQRVQLMEKNELRIGHRFCGVLHTGFDQRSQARLDKIIDGQEWPSEIGVKVSAKQASLIAGVEIPQDGFFYPMGGWICPFEMAQASIDYAMLIGHQHNCNINLKLNCRISQIHQTDTGWALSSVDPTGNTNIIAQHKQLIVASGAELTSYQQTAKIPLSGFRGQVSHVPATGELANLATVICANGYLTPANNNIHCVGASYVKNPSNMDFSLTEQLANGEKMKQSFPNAKWPTDIDVSSNDARVGIRMVSRDHFPVMGIAPDIDALLAKYQEQLQSKDKPSQWQKYWQHTPAANYDGLYLLGGFGSRGLSSAPLVAECLAANLCGEIAPINLPTQALLSGNRMWMRKLLKGKAL
ncbi:FAD-dependent 5-carboxymethylaminomethyl-2-thiouridine(34) oxidoreductase MnmC [Shewanella aestuarii]|uniref:FAD-dependent 5-carboxymethylaminomethyl-2-thiouridine(34) oxidoreductase MnmC n=1 Tax=Shewanella aestuarii TaxID=1028752 RepID=A0A6G9QJB2_9GAMM|nr:FAD-dependent 5-carboxymethylaminomethyl-2-thiouridine(34) oxidoreductase MnmC [Shewanella aestuarii]QIR14155.1 FAD-dependent 5-carboxymethylaminomethyl-2-thiouridine(34) oxidoreductase MnmC [Shewanella aestuarii]